MVLKLPNLSADKGQVIILVLIFLMASVILALALFSRVAGFVLQTRTSIAREQATNLAEAGIDFAVWQLNEPSGTPSTDPLAKRVGVGEFKTKVEDINPTTKRITSTGCIPGCNAAKVTKRKIKVSVTKGTIIPIPYAAHADTGGILLGVDKAAIVGNVYSNGTSSPGPPPESISEICGSGSDECKINGNAYAANKIAPTIGCTGSPCGRFEDQEIKPLPDINENKWKTAASPPFGDSQPCPCIFSGGTIYVGPMQFVGDVTLNSSNNFKVKGPVYITGNLIVDNNSIIQADDSLEGSNTVVIVDGKIEFKNQGVLSSSTLSPITNPSALLLYTANSIYNPAISYRVSSISPNGGILYAKNGRVEITYLPTFAFFQGAVLGKRIEVRNQFGISYWEDFVDGGYIENPSAPWQINRGTYRFAD